MAKGRQTVRLPRQSRKVEGPKAGESTDVVEVQPMDPLSTQNISKVLGLALPLLALAALASPVSQEVLAPVYGRIPSSVNHAEAITATVLIGFIWRYYFQGNPEWSVLPYLTLWAFWIPVLEIYLFQRSSKLGPVIGCIVSGFVTCHTIIIPSAYAAAQALESLKLDEKLGSIAGTAIPAIALNILFFRPLEYVFSQIIRYGTAWQPAIFTPVKLQYLIACSYALLSPAKPYWMFSLAIPSLFHAFLANPHFDSPRNLGILNTRYLAEANWTMLDRRWSTTGYISVAESSDLQYRVLRCDHSLLGGEWLLTNNRREMEGWRVNEPIYAVFEMLEAVRLVETTPPIEDNQAKALVIGLGIGTAPKALMAHGIDTTIVELDPVVHEYATKYFGLPASHTAVIQDAVSWVSNAAKTATTSADQSAQYDYILHDVFTGGAEPLALFTDAFIRDLRTLLAPLGVIALNYAGRLELPLTQLVLQTIFRTFDGNCKVYRDAPPAAPTDTSSGSDDKDAHTVVDDFINMVVFCRKTAGEQVTFRQPVATDFLGSKSRAHYLLPKADYEIPVSLNGTVDEVLTRKMIASFKQEQEESAIRHWYIMRTVLPDIVWEMW